MLSKLSQSLRTIDLSIESVFHLPEILRHILSYALTLRNITSLSLVCKIWKASVRNILGLDDYHALSITGLIENLIIHKKHNIVCSFLYQYIRNSPKRSLQFLLSFVTRFDNDFAASYLKNNYICSLDCLTGWTIAGYTKDCFPSQFESLKGYVSPSGCMVKIVLGLAIHKPGSADSRTLFMLDDFSVPHVYKIFECHSHSIVEDSNWRYISLGKVGEIVESVKCNSKLCNSSIEHLTYNYREGAQLEIYTKSKKFSFGTIEGCKDPYPYPCLTVTDRF